MIFHKGTDSHDYKYGAAIWEECLAVSDPKWHARWPPPRCSTSPAPRPATAPDDPGPRGGRQGDGVRPAGQRRSDSGRRIAIPSAIRERREPSKASTVVSQEPMARSQSAV